MPNQKLENLLNLSLEATPQEREKSMELDVGYDAASRLWDVVVKYSGNLEQVEALGAQVVPLLNEYAIVTIAREQLELLSQLPRIEYIEKPKRLFFSVDQGKAASCVLPLREVPYQLFGKDVLIGVVDSGVDYQHPDFIDERGETRILKIWDQSVPGNPPEGYVLGSEYTSEQINEALRAGNRSQAYEIVPSRDLSGHGTQVLGIAAGNGNASNGTYIGMAPQSDILVVKLGNPREESFPRTTELMQGVDYLIRQGIAYDRPIAINVSFGNNYGSHEGDSLVTTYLDSVSSLGRTVICVGSGNNGRDALHVLGQLRMGMESKAELSVSEYESSLNVQLWKSYADLFDIFITNPAGERVGPLNERLGPQRFYMGRTQLLIYYGKPGPYSTSQEIYIDFLPMNQYVNSGIWTFTLVPRQVVDGRFDMWLPGGGVLNTGTKFLNPNPETTLTVPGTAAKVITVGAYDSKNQTYADFSGRGFTRVTNQVKPDLAAPGVNITTARVGGGYTSVTGTSFATPFVTGATALLMEWGIVRGNDPFLFGEKVKAYLRRGARQVPGYARWPNEMLGYGVLCVRDSLPL